VGGFPPAYLVSPNCQIYFGERHLGRYSGHNKVAFKHGTRVMANLFLAVPIALHLIAAASGGVPTLDVRPSCLAAAKAEITTTDRLQTCMADEQSAHDQLVKTWTKFNGADRVACVSTMMDFEPTYTELLTCLEMASEAGKLPEQLY
jgi:hypothetical protein